MLLKMKTIILLPSQLGGDEQASDRAPSPPGLRNAPFDSRFASDVAQIRAMLFAVEECPQSTTKTAAGDLQGTSAIMLSSTGRGARTQWTRPAQARAATRARDAAADASESPTALANDPPAAYAPKISISVRETEHAALPARPSVLCDGASWRTLACLAASADDDERSGHMHRCVRAAHASVAAAIATAPLLPP
ncbi:hypothetical protein WOLCODRAFT_166997 [Wolfiporia cocos MD-104 SS10]|uniref:Uncharacterized protein n=1 Tax=Wolfiporia cocos (strain MD-104) TaxID=742152 RepID=A0A2H3J3M9_WOLCO|nr:hypothetical protein WOLCODRAFT_166997 [Wolfiporia cocos MD-104 SS10]